MSGEPAPLSTLQPLTPPALDRLVRRCLAKDPDDRWQHAADVAEELRGISQDAVATNGARAATPGRRRHRLVWVLAGTALVLVALVGGAWFGLRSIPGLRVLGRSPTPAKLTDKDTIVLADFDNKTGDAVFDDTLKQGLSVQLEQSPFLNLLSDQRVNETLKLMGRPAGDRLTPAVTQEVCVRTSSTAMLTGSIAQLGSQYVIGLKAVNCVTGDVLAEAQEQAASKEASSAQGSGRCGSQCAERARRVAQLGAEARHAAGGSDHTIPGGVESLQPGTEGVCCKGARRRSAVSQAGGRTRPELRHGLHGLSVDYANLCDGAGGGEQTQSVHTAREDQRAGAVLHRRGLLLGDRRAGQGGAFLELWQETYPRYAGFTNCARFYSTDPLATGRKHWKSPGGAASGARCWVSLATSPMTVSASIGWMRRRR